MTGKSITYTTIGGISLRSSYAGRFGTNCIEAIHGERVIRSCSISGCPGPGVTLAPCGSMTVSAQVTANLTTGSTYTWDATLLHRAWAAPGHKTATLIVQGPPIRKRTTVLVDTDRCAYPPMRPQLRALPLDELDDALSRLASYELESGRYSSLDHQFASDSCLIA